MAAVLALKGSPWRPSRPRSVTRPARAKLTTPSVKPLTTRGRFAKRLVDKLGRGRRYHAPPDAAITIAALLALREHVIGPILAGAALGR